MATTQIAIGRRGPVTRLQHDRPEMRNAESSALLDELDVALRPAKSGESGHVIVIGGHGEQFSTERDPKEAQAMRAGFAVEKRWTYEDPRYLDYGLHILDRPKPAIAEVQGARMAGGCVPACAERGMAGAIARGKSATTERR